MTLNTRTMRISIIAGVAVLLASAIGAGVALNPSGSSAGVAEAEDAGSLDSAICKGFVDVDPKVAMLYPSAAGRVVEVLAIEGKEYKAGEILLRLDRKLADQQLLEAEADRDIAKEQLAQARTLPQRERNDKVKQQGKVVSAAKHKLAAAVALDRFRQEQLKNNNILKDQALASTEEVAVLKDTVAAEQSRLDELKGMDVDAKARLAAKQLAAKEAQVEKAKLAVDECDLKAPVKGKVLRVHVAKGEVLGPQPRTPAIEFYTTEKPLIIRAEVEQEFANLVAIGKAARIEDDTRAGRSWTGKVIRVSDWYTHRRSIFQEPLNYNDVRTLECIVAIDAGQSPLRIGQRVRVTIGKAN